MSVLALVLSTFLLVVGEDSTRGWIYNAIGWFCATWIAEGCFIAYRLIDRKRRARPDYVVLPLEKRVFGGVILACLAVGAWHAGLLAYWWAS